MIIAEGRSPKHIYALIDTVRRIVKHRIIPDETMPPNISIEGYDSEDWMVLDLGKILLHVFTPEARLAYNLEGMWVSIYDPMAQFPESQEECDMIAEWVKQDMKEQLTPKIVKQIDEQAEQEIEPPK